MRRLATVSTGWKINNSKIPELALPKKRAVPDSDFPLAMGGDIVDIVIFFLKKRSWGLTRKGGTEEK